VKEPPFRFPLSLLLAIAFSSCVFAQEKQFSDPSLSLVTTLPRTARDCTASRTQQVLALAEAIESWTAEQSWDSNSQTPQQILELVRGLVEAKGRVDKALDETLSLRGIFADLPPDESRRQSLQQYLRVTSQLIDLSGRMRYLLRDAIDNATYDLSPYPEQLDAMIDLLVQHRVTIGAEVMSYALFNPPPESELDPFSIDTKRKILRLFAASGDPELLADVAELLREKTTPAELVVLAIEVVRQIGLPQNSRPGQDPALPTAAITAGELHEILSRVDTAELTPKLAQHRAVLLEWLAERSRRGVLGDTFRVSGFDVRPGDWLLMRNPSPYNLFTDLSPGLFTHVGVVTVEVGSDGLRRFVIADLPERGDRVPATNVDVYVRQTLHYFFVRHKDPAVGQKMGEVAASLIGNQTQFDLRFETDRVLALKGQPLAGRPIHTYCAGFLLVCAQETTAPRSDFFPIAESQAGGHCLENLAKLGLSIGDNFVSPTGAIFSPHLEVVGRREPMYDPGREIKEAIYDYFAFAMINKRLTPSPDAYQTLREKIAGLSKRNRWLARALAQANNVSQHMDLEAAAKAAAVIETLDDIANASMDAFYDARAALQAGPLDQLDQQNLPPQQLQRILLARRQHAELFQAWDADQISPRQVRIELVKYYTAQGKRQLDDRFFRSE
jgi:hypothetical protein